MNLAQLRAALLYEDHHVLAFDKPAGLAVQGGSGVTTSLDALVAEWPSRGGRVARLAHRLDRDTTGVVVAGRTPTAIAALNRAFSERRAAKRYLALVCGAPRETSGVIEAPLVKAKVRGVDLMKVAAPGERGAQEATTAWETLATSASAALIEARPTTGRMHQIRVHLSALGVPIFGDLKYGGLFALGAVPAPGLMLHAAALEVPHPAGGSLAVRAAAPASFRAAALALGLDHPILTQSAAASRTLAQTADL